MFTIIETPTFSKLWPDYWDEDELGDFLSWLAANPEVGDVIPRSGGCRKVRWTRPGMGKRGGVRIVHYNRLSDGVIYLLLIYGKSAVDNVDGRVLKEIRDTLK